MQVSEPIIPEWDLYDDTRYKCKCFYMESSIEGVAYIWYGKEDETYRFINLQETQETEKLYLHVQLKY